MDITALKAVYNYAFRLNLISKSDFLNYSPRVILQDVKKKSVC